MIPKYESITLEEQEVKDIVTTALEGGIGYWSFVELPPGYPDNVFPVAVYDIEDDTTSHGVLTEENVRNGVNLHLKDNPVFWANQAPDDLDIDAAAADDIIQYALFGKVVFA